MTTFERFCERSKMRHDFDDRIQVRYFHSNGEHYDTWVSGEEAMQRLRSELAEKRLRELSRLDREKLEAARRRLPDEGKSQLGDLLRQRLADGVEEMLGGNPIGEGLADAARGGQRDEGEDDVRTVQWQERLRQPAFRAYILELAWSNLRGSFPEEEDQQDLNDWI